MLTLCLYTEAWLGLLCLLMCQMTATADCVVLRPWCYRMCRCSAACRACCLCRRRMPNPSMASMPPPRTAQSSAFQRTSASTARAAAFYSLAVSFPLSLPLQTKTAVHSQQLAPSQAHICAVGNFRDSASTAGINMASPCFAVEWSPLHTRQVAVGAGDSLAPKSCLLYAAPE